MRAFVAGATGALGRTLVRQMVADGHEVVGLARSDRNEATLRGLGARPVRADIFDADSLARAAEGCEAVVRTATFISTRSKPTREDWAMNDRIRREGTRNLLDAARRVDARLFLQESVVWVARPDDGTPFDESSPPRPDEVTRSALDAEQMAAASGIPAMTLRLGWLYGPDTAHTRQFADMLRRRRLPVIGSGETPLSFLHVDDAGSAFLAAAKRPKPGPWHVVDDRPTPIARFLDRFAELVGAPRPMRVPAWLARVGAGAYVTRFLTTPMVTRNAPFRQATGWAPRYATVDEGLRQTAEGLRAAAPVAA